MDLIPAEYHHLLPQLFILVAIMLVVFPFLLLIALLKLGGRKREQLQAEGLLKEYKIHNRELEGEVTELKVRTAKLTTIIKNERLSHAEKLRLLQEAKEQLSLQFQSLAQQIFDEKSERFGQENRERITALLTPLQEQLSSFQQRINDIQANDIRERSSLREEIVHLKELNQHINREAINLTRALKGDKKLQGNWGELVLERVLESSGLRNGEEYSTQGGFRDAENRLMKPDVLIHLPDQRQIIIDSKVSLLAWEKYINSTNEGEKEVFLKEHISNLRKHVAQLSEKSYSDLKGITSLDFVLLFIPIDASYISACQMDDQLFADAYEKRIIIVTPTTLLATLKTVENLWRYEQQNKNAKEIADRAGSIYDKLRGFLVDMEKVGKQLATCTTTYESALGKLAHGKGNIISQAGRLTELGVTVKKKIPESIESLADTDKFE